MFSLFNVLKLNDCISYMIQWFESKTHILPVNWTFSIAIETDTGGASLVGKPKQVTNNKLFLKTLKHFQTDTAECGLKHIFSNDQT